MFWFKLQVEGTPYVHKKINANKIKNVFASAFQGNAVAFA